MKAPKLQGAFHQLYTLYTHTHTYAHTSLFIMGSVSQPMKTVPSSLEMLWLLIMLSGVHHDAGFGTTGEPPEGKRYNPKLQRNKHASDVSQGGKMWLLTSQKGAS